MSRHYPTRPLACLVLLSGLTAGSVQARSVTMVHVAMFEAKYAKPA